MMNLRLAKYGKLRPLWVSYLGLAGTGLVGVLGAACMVEMTYHLQLNAAVGPEMNFLGATINAKSLTSWFGAGFVLLTGVAGCLSCAGGSLPGSGAPYRREIRA